MQYRVLRLLEDHPEYSQRQIAAALGTSLGRTHYCLAALVRMGHVKIENFKASRHKLGYMHILTPHGMAERSAIAGRFLNRKIAEYEALASEIEALKRDAQ